MESNIEKPVTCNSEKQVSTFICNDMKDSV